MSYFNKDRFGIRKTDESPSELPHKSQDASVDGSRTHRGDPSISAIRLMDHVSKPDKDSIVGNPLGTRSDSSFVKMIEKVYVPRIIAVSTEDDIDLPTYICCMALVNHSRAVDVAEQVGKTLSSSQTDGVDRWAIRSRAMGLELNSRADVMRFLKRIFVRHPHLPELLSNLARGK